MNCVRRTISFSANSFKIFANIKSVIPGTSRLILLTHGHFDHIGAVKELQAGHTTDGAICKGKIFTLPEETILLSGHSAPTTVGDEKNYPWFSE